MEVLKFHVGDFAGGTEVKKDGDWYTFDTTQMSPDSGSVTEYHVAVPSDIFEVRMREIIKKNKN